METTTLHIALANFPMRDEKGFIESIEKGCYDRHRENFFSYTQDGQRNDLYKPFKYYVFGNYDIAFISLINNFDFAQKLFIPKFSSGPSEEILDTPPYAYQIITGILKKGTNSSQFGEELYRKYPFLGICNFKLNNGFLVGNGVRFTDSIADLIQTTLKEDVLKGEGAFIILHSFSWFEFSVLVFSKDPNAISEAISKLRSKKICDLTSSENLIKSSSKFNFFVDSTDATDIIELLSKSDVFSDTQSYFCVRYDFYNSTENISEKDIPLRTEIEWQIKPGHFSAFKKVISKKFAEFDVSSISLITGKSDYVIDNKSDNFINNHTIQKAINEELQTKEFESKELINHVRNIRTRVYLDSHDFNEQPANNPHKDRTSFRAKLFFRIDIEEYNQKLKKLKISKQCRANVLKMFYHYKNGIKDPVLSIYFFDFYFFIIKIMEEIDWQCSILDAYYNKPINFGPINVNRIDVGDDPNDVEEFELKLAKSFNIFEEALNIRMLNSYRYEDISDINLDFNSSIQQLLSMYNTLAHAVGDLFKSSNNHFIVLINDRSTVANAKSINYSVYDLLTPEFIFYSLPKEILNYYHYTYSDYRETLMLLENDFLEIIRDVRSEHYSEYLNELYNTGIIDFVNLFIEQIRFYFSFNLNPDCYIYWTWSYAFKNSSAYNISGSFKETNFISELLRLMFTLKMYDFDVSKITCPLPQHETYWQTLFPKIEQELNRFFSKHKKYVKEFKEKILYTILKFVNEDVHNVDIAKIGVRKKDFLTHLKFPDIQNKALLESLNDIAGYFELSTEGPLRLTELTITQANLRWVMFRYLRFIYLGNKSKSGYINFLYRNWENSKPLQKYNEIDAKETIDYYYRIDQTGGVFFPSSKKMEEYFELRNLLLVKLWDFSSRETNEILKKIAANA